jgi:hypothetical protein
MRNTLWNYISKSFDDIQVQYNMHRQEASMPMDGDDDFIAQETNSRYSTAQVGVRQECKTHYSEVFDMLSGKDWRISIIRHKASSILSLDLTGLTG